MASGCVQLSWQRRTNAKNKIAAALAACLLTSCAAQDCGPDSDAFGRLAVKPNCSHRRLSIPSGSAEDCNEACAANEFNYCMYYTNGWHCYGVQEFVEGGCVLAANDANIVYWRVCGSEPAPPEPPPPPPETQAPTVDSLDASRAGGEDAQGNCVAVDVTCRISKVDSGEVQISDQSCEQVSMDSGSESTSAEVGASTRGGSIGVEHTTSASVTVGGSCRNIQVYDNSNDQYVVVNIIQMLSCKGERQDGCHPENCDAPTMGEKCLEKTPEACQPEGVPGTVSLCQGAVAPSSSLSNVREAAATPVETAAAGPCASAPDLLGLLAGMTALTCWL